MNIAKSIFYLYAVFFIIVNSLYSQGESTLENTKPPLSEHTVYLNVVQTLETWTIASLPKPTSMTELYVDKLSNIYFGYYDTKLGLPVYVHGKDGNFIKREMDKTRGRGHLLAMAKDKAFNVYAVYLDEKDNTLWYANNAGVSTFTVTALDRRLNINAIQMKPVISVFNKPIVFFVDKNGYISVSRYLKDRFITEYLYTNSRIKSIYPVTSLSGYVMYLQEYDTGNIIYSSKKSNESFKYAFNNAIVTNSLLFSVHYESSDRFSIAYTKKDSPNNIHLMSYDFGIFSDSLIVESDEEVEKLDLATMLSSEKVVLYKTSNSRLRLYVESVDIDLSNVVGEVSGDIYLASSYYPYFYILYYSDLFNEIRVSFLNINDIDRLKNRR